FIVIESQLNYAMGALKAMRDKQLIRLEVREAVQRRYNCRVQKALQGTVWNTGGCSSYYIDRNGKNSTGFPWSSGTMQRLLQHFDLDSYSTLAEDELTRQGVTAMPG
ncbi:MAG TPA: 4-hydroxyacetophenone monooxygenase, partial [Pseudomonadales bacterium]